MYIVFYLMDGEPQSVLPKFVCSNLVIIFCFYALLYKKLKLFFMIQIYHNSCCGKIEGSFLLFRENSGQKYEIVKYLEEVPSLKN